MRDVKALGFNPTNAILAFSIGGLVSAVFLLIFYPGLMSSDSVSSWSQAQLGVFDTIKPPMLALFQSVLLSIFRNGEGAVAFFSFLQGTLFWGSIFLILTAQTKSWTRNIIGCVAIFALMPLWPHTSVHWTDNWVLSFLLLAIVCILEARRNLTWPWIAGASAFMFLAVSTRYNALSAAPVLFFAYAPYLKRHTGLSIAKSSLLATLGIIAIVLSSNVFTIFPNVVKSPSLLRFAVFNQYLGTIANSDPELRDKLISQEAPLFNSRLGAGKLEDALPYYLPSGNGLLYWPKDAVIGFENIMDNGDFLISRLPFIIAESPGGYLRHKFRYIVGQLTESAIYYGYHPYIDPNSLGVVSKPILPGSSWVFSTLDYLKPTLIYQHWFALALGIVSAIVAAFRKQIAPVVLVSAALFYAAPYMVSETGWEWRYLMPSYVCSFLSLALVLLHFGTSNRVHVESLTS